MLQHERDSKIHLEETSHTYHIGDDTSFISVTTFIGKFFPKFDIDGSVLINKSRQLGITPKELKRQWDEKAKKGREKGTHIHKCIELYNTKISSNIGSEEELQYYLQFRKDYPNLECVRSEWCIYDEDLKLAGTIDAIYQDKVTKELFIIDYKTNSRLSFTGFGGEKAYEPISHLHNCDFDKYSLQLSLYKHILKTKYGLDNIAGLKLLWLNSANGKYKVINCENYQKEVKVMINHLSNP